MAYQYYPYQPNFFQGAAPDQLSQLRQPYQPMQAPQPMPQMNQQPAPSQSIVWVSGEAEAAAYLVAPNSAAALWDMNAPVIYFKQADASGRPTMKTYDLVERTATPVTGEAPKVDYYVTRAELESITARLEALETPKKRNAKEEVKDA